MCMQLHIYLQAFENSLMFVSPHFSLILKSTKQKSTIVAFLLENFGCPELP